MIDLQALTAAGGNSRAARSMRARLQWRDRFGRWIEMGRGIKFKVRGSDGATRSVIGAFVGAKDSNVGQVYVSKDPNGLPDGFYDVTSNNAQEFVANLDESQLAERGIELGRDANGRAVGERAVEDVPNINELVRADAPEGWEAQPGTFGGKKVIQTEDGDFRIHFGGKDETVLLEDHRANPGQADPQRSVGEAFKKVTDVDMQREQSGDQAYTSLSEGNDEALASRSRDDKVEQIKANERTLANERAPLGAKQTAMDSNNQLQQELEQEGQPYDPEGNDSDEALAARKAAAPAQQPAEAAAPVSTGDIDTSTFDVSPEGFLVPTGKRTNDISPEGLANFMTAEKESLGKGGARLVVDTDAGTAEIHNSADTLDNAKAQAGGLGQTSVLDLAGGKEVSLADNAVDPNAPDVNPNLDGDTSPEAPNAQDRDPNAVEPERAGPRADAPASPEPDAEAQPERTAEPSPAGDTPADPGAAPERPAGGNDQPEPRAEDPEPARPAADPGSVAELKARRTTAQAALENAGDPKDIVALNEQIDSLDNRIAARERDEARPDEEDHSPESGDPETVADEDATRDLGQDQEELAKQISGLQAQQDRLQDELERGASGREDDEISAEIADVFERLAELQERFENAEADRNGVTDEPAELTLAQKLDSAWAQTDPFPDSNAERRERAALRILRDAEKRGDLESGLVRLSDEEKAALSDEIAEAVGIPRERLEQRAPEAAVPAPAPEGGEAPEPSAMAQWTNDRVEEWRDLQSSEGAPEGVAGQAWAVQKMMGTDGGPEVLSSEYFDAAEGEELFRGVSSPEQKSAFIDGNDFVGMGGNGSGIYLSTERGHAARYGNFEAERIIDAKLKPGANIVDASELEARRQADFERNYEEGNLLAAQLASGDLNTYASAIGVDGYRIELEGVPSVVIANKGALLVRGADTTAAREAPEAPAAPVSNVRTEGVSAGELSVGDYIRHPETDNLVRINNISVEDFPEEGYAEYTVSYDSKNESEEDANEAAGLITLFNSDRVDTFEDWGDDAPESDTPEPDDAPEADAEATPEPARVPETNEERMLQAAENLNRRESEYLDVLMRDDYTDEDFETAEALRDQARREFDDARNAMDRERAVQQPPAPEPTPEPVTLNENAAPETSELVLAPMLDTIEAREAEMDEVAGGGLYDQRNDPRKVSSGHENKLAALRARAMGKDLTDEQREILDQIFDSELSDADLDELNVRIDGLPNRPNTVTLARPEREQPDYMSTADVDIITAERDDPNFVFDEDLTWRRVREEFPDLEELANGDRILDENTVKGKRYQVVARRTQKNRFMVYVLETDAQGNRRAKRIGNTEWHSYEAFERRITEARKLINSKSPAGSLARRKDQPTEDLGVQGFPQDDFLGDIGNPLAPLPATGDEKFDRLLEVVATHIRNGDADLSGIEEHLQQLDPGANAINTIMNAVVGRAQDTYRPDGNNPFQMYGGEMAEVGMHFDWTDWHQELNWWLPDGSLNKNRTANPNHGLVGRGRIVGYVKENTDGKGHTYGDHVWVQMLQPDGSWGSWVKRSAQTLRQTEPDAPLGQPFFSKREEWRTDPEALARRFRVPQAAPDEPVQTKERPRRDLPTSRRLRFTTRGNLAGYSNVPVPTSPNEVIRMVTTGEIQNNINRVDSLRPGMLITRLDTDGNQHVDSIIRVENLGDGGYRVHAARPNGTGSADVDSFVVPGDAYIESWNSPMIPAPREAEPENRLRGELVQLDDGSRGVVAFDDGKGNLMVTTPGNETIDILESNIEVVPDAEVSGEERRDLMDSFDEYDLPDFIRQMILAGLLSPSLTRDRYNQLARTVRAFKPTSSVMRFIDRILAMIGVPRDQRRDARNYFNQ